MEDDNDQENYDKEDIEYVSKSQMKREMLALQALGEKLVELSADQLAQLNLPEELKKALLQAKQIKKHGAKRRQFQYIGRLMRNVNAEDILAQYENVTQQSAQAVQQLHKIEKWRERLLEQGDEAIQALVEEFPDLDRNHLRQLIRTAKQEQAQNRPPRAYRKIFQLIKAKYD
ncbi:ribosome biogenesis factor YjgA [Kaarinaea lacus]